MSRLKLHYLTLICFLFVPVFRAVLNDINCGEGLWHQGFNPDSGITFSAMDVGIPGADLIHIAVGGSSTDAADLNTNVNSAGNTKAAIIIIFK